MRLVHKYLCTLLASRQGAVAVIFGITLVPLLLAAGAAIDTARAYYVKTRLGYALDAAGLAVGSSTGTETELKAIADKFFKANYPDAVLGHHVSLDTVVTSRTVSMTATRSVDTLFMRLAGYDAIDVRNSIEVTREIKGLEVALVLDNTGSMATNNKIGALRTSATDLVNILFGDNAAPEKLKIGIVPFVSSVNIGTAYASAVDFTGTTFTATTWKGCVIERAYPHSIQDTSIVAGGKWKAYEWPKEPRFRTGSTSTSSSCVNRANSAGTGWSSIDNTPSTTSGPNKACPQPVRQLTNAKAALLNDISTMTPWDGVGTMNHVGLGWGIRVLSDGDPFHVALPYGTEGYNKAIVLMTDGVNTLVTQNSNCYNNSNGPYTMYSGAGYPVDDNTLGTGGTTKANKLAKVEQKLDTLTAEACTYAKSKGILLYTILLEEPDPAAETLYRNCATSPDKFFLVPDAADLQKAFRAIADDLSNLRLSK